VVAVPALKRRGASESETDHPGDLDGGGVLLTTRGSPGKTNQHDRNWTERSLKKVFKSVIWRSIYQLTIVSKDGFQIRFSNPDSALLKRPGNRVTESRSHSTNST
jgi:hypothetical protein